MPAFRLDAGQTSPILELTGARLLPPKCPARKGAADRAPFVLLLMVLTRIPPQKPGFFYLRFTRAKGNRRWKFCVVCSARVSTVTPRSGARNSATSRTYSGRLGLPRWGIGARYGAAGSVSQGAAGTWRATSRSASALRKVTMPDREI